MSDATFASTFHGLFATEPDAAADAPGRVNLIGEHTDYHGGFVLPCAIPQRTRVELARRSGSRVRLWSSAHPGRIFEFEVGRERRLGEWTDYVASVTSALARTGVSTGGFDMRVDSDVPIGAGLSSSASLEVAALRALRRAWLLRLDDVALARVAHTAEVEFVGAPVGVMDRMAASLARGREALFLDTRSLHYERIPLPASIDLIIVDSALAHRHAGGGYTTRRAESEQAARLLGVALLRDMSTEDIPKLAALPPALARRAR